MKSEPHTTGRYPIERRKGEIERLLVQAEALAADAEIMLERIGVAAGWHCLDLGCGPGGITGLLSRRVGATGRVLGLDADSVFLDYARREKPSNVDFVQGDAYRTELEGASFDLVHARFLATTAGEPAKLFREAMRLAKPRGVVAFQDSDISSLKCFPPHPAWDRLRDAVAAVLQAVGADPCFGQRLYRMARGEGMRDVEYRPFVVGVRSGDPMTDFLPATAESMRSALIEHSILSSAELDVALAECRAHLTHPDLVFNLYTTVQVWGRVP
jgi:ubiquinone/menaquinone biosynthesis C-methylase UbiE